MTGPEDPGHGHFLASDADREQVIDRLKVAFTEGRLTQDELDLRVGQAFVSRTYADLHAVTADIPARSAEAWPFPKAARAPSRTADSTAESKAIRWGLGVGTSIVSAMIAASALSGNEDVGRYTGMLVFFYVLFLMIAVGNVIDSRLENRRARKQLPPGPGGRTGRGGRRGVAGYGPAPRGARPGQASSDQAGSVTRTNETSTDETSTELRAHRPKRDRSLAVRTSRAVRAGRVMRPAPGAV
jgi:DUF1707 SHOCT-like domain